MSDLIRWLHEFADVCEIVAAGRWPGPRTAARLREVADALAAQQPAAVGEGIMVNAAHGVFTLPLHPSGLLKGLRFVVHVPAPEQQPETPTLAKHQPCGCVLCTCEDEKQCQGCGAKFCGNRTDHPAYVKQPAAEPRSTHRAWRRNDWLLSYFEALSDHHIGCEQQPAAVDNEENQRTWQALWLVLNQTGTVVVPGSDIVSADWSRCQIEQTVHESTGAVQFRAILLPTQQGGSDNGH